MEQVKIGQEIVSDSGIGRVVRIGDFGSYTAEMIISKEAFIEAFEKWVLPKLEESGKVQMPTMVYPQVDGITPIVVSEQARNYDKSLSAPKSITQ